MRRCLFALLVSLGCNNATTSTTMSAEDSGMSASDSSAPNPSKDSGMSAMDAGWKCDPPAAPGSFYELSARDLRTPRTVSMCEFRGQVVLVVNVASYCGYTPQYKGLEAAYSKYESQGFVVLGFPCNQFGNQEPGDASDILDFCEKTYGVQFPMFEKVDVNGPKTHPIYTWLKSQPGGAGNITWNFNKFLLGRDGKLIKRYAETVTPEDPSFITDLETALKK